MTSEGKLLKVLCLASMFVGLAVAMLGATLVVPNLHDADAWLTAGEGAGATIFGVRSAILANVPSNTARIRMKALVLSVLAITVVAYLLFGGAQYVVTQVIAAASIALIALCSLVMASRIVKEQLRK